MKTRHVFLFLIAAGIYALGLVPTLDPDMGWHLKTGEWILKHGVPTTDPFSFTVPGHFWTAHEWLSEVIMQLLYGLGGYAALMISFALLGVLISGFVYRTCPARPYLAAVSGFVFFMTSRYLWGARPQIFNILMLSVFLWLIQNVRRGRFHRKALYALPLLMLVWANLHSGYLLGIVVMTAFLAGDLFQIFILHSEEGTLGEKGLGHFSGVMLLCVAAVGINPAGYKILLYPFATLSSPMMQAKILEWQTPIFRHWNYWPFLGVMSLGAAAFLLCPPRRNVSNFLIYAGSMAMGLFARRHIPFFAIAAIPMIAWAISENPSGSAWAARWGDAALTGSRRRFRYLLNTLLALALVAGLAVWTDFRLRQNPFILEKNFPVKAVQFLKARGDDAKFRIFNEYVWGGYLIGQGFPVFIDGRADLYGDKFFSEYLAAYDMRRGLGDIARMLKRYRVDVLLVKTGGLVSRAFSSNPQWRIAFWDRTASVFLPRDLADPGMRIPSLNFSSLSKEKKMRTFPP